MAGYPEDNQHAMNGYEEEEEVEEVDEEEGHPGRRGGRDGGDGVGYGDAGGEDGRATAAGDSSGKIFVGGVAWETTEGELIDMEKSTQGGEDLYIRINRLSGNKRKIITLEIVLPVVSSLLILICIGLIWIYIFKGKQGSKEIWRRLILGYTSTSNELADIKLEFPFMSFGEISAATNNFSESNILGQGGFGNVYKGRLENGNEIAVKRLRQGSGQGIVEFKNEIVLIAKLQHRNLVKLLGCSIHKDEKLLIYEYLPNKSLDAFLFSMFWSRLAESQLLVKRICITDKRLHMILSLSYSRNLRDEAEIHLSYSRNLRDEAEIMCEICYLLSSFIRC